MTSPAAFLMLYCKTQLQFNTSPMNTVPLQHGNHSHDSLNRSLKHRALLLYFLTHDILKCRTVTKIPEPEPLQSSSQKSQSPYPDISHSRCTFPAHKVRSSIGPEAVLNQSKAGSRFLFKVSLLTTLAVQLSMEGSLLQIQHSTTFLVSFSHTPSALGPSHSWHIKGQALSPSITSLQERQQLKGTNTCYQVEG